MNVSVETANWLNQHQRNGNWYDIADSDVIPLDISGPMLTVLHMFQLAFSPEIKRRLHSGELDDKFVLSCAQLIQPLEGSRIIRLNEEVRGIGTVRADRPVQKGDPVYYSDLRRLESFDLEEDELDAGHFTLFWFGNGWFISFDFRSGRSISARLLDIALEFLETAQHAQSQSHARACLDNLFSACELASKARLLLHHSPAANAKTHGSIHSAINQWGHLGNVDEKFLGLFNRMTSGRSAAKYNTDREAMMPSALDLQVARDEIVYLRETVGQQVKSIDNESE